MKIAGTKVRNIEKYLQRLPDGASFRISIALRPDQGDLLKALGFGGSPQPGATMLPYGEGPVASFNADGKHVPRKDLPKESRYIRTIEWSWEQWEGRYSKTVTEERDVYMDCYQQEFIAPPSVELTYVEHSGSSYLVSPPFDVKASGHAAIKHAVNLFLELFGGCELRRADLAGYESIPTMSVNWRLLPPGKYPWDRVADHLEHAIRTKDPRVRSVILNRHETIKKYSPTEVFVGDGGFERYVAYVFSDRELVVLECSEKGNAIYIFGRNWQEFAKLTKAEVLSNSVHLERIVHREGWRALFDKVMRARACVLRRAGRA